MADTRLIALEILVICVQLIDISAVKGHGMLTEPPSRNTMWRYGYKNPANNDDNSLFCGGRYNQWTVNGGRCGVCGDPYQGPLRHEAGYTGPGEGYANGIIGRHYKTGAVINVQVKITANHLGYFKFRICPMNDQLDKVTEQCLNRYPLRDVNHTDKFDIGSQSGDISFQIQLPADLRCRQCVFQWYYATGNMGYEHETYINCADIAISDEGETYTTTLSPPLMKRYPLYKTNEQGEDITSVEWDCDPVAPYDGPGLIQRMYKWCIFNCILVLPKHRRCSEDHCHCYRVGETTTTFSDTTGNNTDLTTVRTTERPTTPPGPLIRRTHLYKKDNQGDDISTSQWDCDVLSPYNSPDKIQTMYNWCIYNCILPLPLYRLCSSVHCKCYKLKVNRDDNQSQHQTQTTSTDQTYSTESHQQTFTGSRPNHITTAAPQITLSGGDDNSKIAETAGYCNLLSPYDSKPWASKTLEMCYTLCVPSQVIDIRTCPRHVCDCTPTNKNSGLLNLPITG